MIPSLRLFLPICLYARSVYRTRKGMQAVFSQYLPTASAALVLVCDDLHALNQLMVQRYRDSTSAQHAARAQGARTVRQVYNVLDRMKHAETDVAVHAWRELAEDPRFSILLQKIRSLHREDVAFARLVASFVGRHNEILRRVLHPDAMGIELNYLLNEIAMSIFVTEVLGFNTEVWEAAPKRDMPDPLAFLYQNRSALLAELLQKHHLSRQMLLVEDSH